MSEEERQAWRTFVDEYDALVRAESLIDRVRALPTYRRRIGSWNRGATGPSRSSSGRRLAHPGRSSSARAAHQRPTTQVPRRSSRRSVTGHAPSDVFEITVWVVVEAGSCTLRNETPASLPTSMTTSRDAWSQKPRP